MIHLDDIRKKVISSGRYRSEYRASCDNCGVDRGYLTKQNAIKSPNCRKCSHKNISEETINKMSAASKGRVPWNKGLSGVSEETSFKMSIKKLGRSPVNKGQTCSLEQRVKLSCLSRGISVDDFDDFTTEESRRERNRFTDMGLHVACFAAYNYQCDRCSIGGVVLHAHHLMSWKHFPDLRFELTNLVTLCATCHKKFHTIYGNGKTESNTEKQYREYRSSYLMPQGRRSVALVVGVAGAGKSWVCNQLKHLAYYHEHDKNPRSEVRSAIWNAPLGMIIYDPFSHVSTFIKRNSDIFDIKIYVIDETVDVVKYRLASRGGRFTQSVEKRMKRMKNLAKQAYFTGTADEVLIKLLTDLS